jgi:hypothetical protein
MTNLPGEGLTPQPIDPEAQLRIRSAEIIARLGELGLEMAALTGEFTAINEQLARSAGDTTTPEASAVDDTPVELFSAVGRQAARTQEELNNIAEKNEVLADKLQDIFAPSVLLFEGAMISKLAGTTNTDNKAPQAMPKYDSSDPHEWKKFVKRHGKELKWEEKDPANTCKYTIKYVQLAGDGLELVGYSYDYTSTSGQRTFTDAHGHKSYLDNSKVEVEYASGLARRAQAHTSTTNWWSDETFDLDNMTYRRGNRFQPTLTYNPEEYLFEKNPGSGKQADEIVQALTQAMSFLPTVEQPGVKQEI